jgi:hypothetical protein
MANYIRDYVLDTKLGRYIITTGLGFLAATQIAAADGPEQQDSITIRSKNGKQAYGIPNDGKTMKMLEKYTGIDNGTTDVFINAQNPRDTIVYGDWKSAKEDRSDLLPAAKAADVNKDGFVTYEEALAIYNKAKKSKLGGY